MLETCLCTFCKWWIILMFLLLLLLAALILPFGAVLPWSLVCAGIAEASPKRFA